MKHSYEINPRPVELGGGWQLRLLEDHTAERTARLPGGPPPPHRASATLRAGGIQVTGFADSPVGRWTHSLLEGLERCWGPKKPLWSVARRPLAGVIPRARRPRSPPAAPQSGPGSP